MRELMIKRGDVFWWECPAHHREHIQEGRRPCVIVSNNVCNRSSGVVTILPFTSKVKKSYPQQVPTIFNKTVSIALADQITSVPKSELMEKICHLAPWQMDQIDHAIKVQLGMADFKEEDEDVSCVDTTQDIPDIKRTKWTRETVVKFCRDYDRLPLDEVLAMYHISKTTAKNYRVRFQKKMEEGAKSLW